MRQVVVVPHRGGIRRIEENRRRQGRDMTVAKELIVVISMPPGEGDGFAIPASQIAAEHGGNAVGLIELFCFLSEARFADGKHLAGRHHLGFGGWRLIPNWVMHDIVNCGPQSEIDFRSCLPGVASDSPPIVSVTSKWVMGSGFARGNGSFVARAMIGAFSPPGRIEGFKLVEPIRAGWIAMETVGKTYDERVAALVFVEVHLQREAHLVKTIPARRGAGLCPGPRKGREEERREDGNNGHHDEQFEEGKGGTGVAWRCPHA